MVKQKLRQKQIKELEKAIIDVKRKSGEVRREQAVLMCARSIPTETIILATGFSKSRIFGLHIAYIRDCSRIE